MLSVTLKAAGDHAIGLLSVGISLLDRKLRLICIMRRNQNKGLAAWKHGINLIWQEITAG